MRLLGKDRKLVEVVIPEGWEKVVGGNIQPGDRIWIPPLEAFEDTVKQVDLESTCVGPAEVSAFFCVIRKT